MLVLVSQIFIAKKPFFLALLLAICLFSGCNVATHRLNTSGLAFPTLSIDNPQIEKTFQAAKANNKIVLVVFGVAINGNSIKWVRTLISFSLIELIYPALPASLKHQN